MSNKNQHYVSQTYLRWFGIPHDSGQPKAINLFAIGAKKVVHDASIKTQCSHDYFYGRDNKAVEDLLQFFEGHYGAAMASLDRGAVTTREVERLMQFLFLQYLRTPFQLEERLRLIEKFGTLEMAGKRVRDKLPPVDRVREVQRQLYIFAKEHSAFADLIPVILINRTKVPFITSDNPALYLNRLYSQRYSDPTAGLIQSGAIAAMPLSPRILLLAYDSDVYQPIGKDSVLEVRRESDVERLNELQVVRAMKTLFFQNRNEAEYVTRLFDKYASGRKKEWSFTWVGIRDGEDGEFERFRTVTPEDRDSLEPRIQSMSPILPAPTTWPSFVKFRMRPRGWATGSVVGFVREAHSGRSREIRRIVLPDRIPLHHTPLYRKALYQRKEA